MQARSQASVTAVLDAALQVLVAVGQERLTTSRVAVRAGVSVGTLYQYFPNKHALLQAVLRRHLDRFTTAIEACCARHHGEPLAEAGAALVGVYLRLKMRRMEESAALYAVAAAVGGAAIREAAAARSVAAATAAFASAPERLTRQPELMAATVLCAMNGTAQRLLENRSNRRLSAQIAGETKTMISAYLAGCCR